MGLEVYYPQDIRNALLAAEQATNAALPARTDDLFTQGYLTGYRAALTTLALAFGLVSRPLPPPSPFIPDLQHLLS